MALYILGDTHLSASGEKSMEVFGPKWENYTQRLATNWRAIVTPDDSVIIAGDVSWAMGLSEAKEDFDFLNNLPGNKYIIKGNHDYWWDTLTKLNRWTSQHGYTGIHFLHNNAYKIEDYIICGSRGWFTDEEKAGDAEFNKKILAREVGRLKLSLDAGQKLLEQYPNCRKIAVLHYPPLYGDYICPDILNLLEISSIARCYFGHIHGIFRTKSPQEYKNITFELISADYLGFHPKLIDA